MNDLPSDCTKPTLDSQATLKTDHQLVKDQRPIRNGHGPLFEDISVSQEKQFTSRFGGRENAFGFGDFAQLAMVAFDGIGGVDQAPDLSGISEEGRQVLPVVLPHRPDVLREERMATAYLSPHFSLSWRKLASALSRVAAW